MIIFLGKKTSHHHRHWSLPRLFIQGWVIQTFHLISALLVGETQGIPRGPGARGCHGGHPMGTIRQRNTSETKISGHTDWESSPEAWKETARKQLFRKLKVFLENISMEPSKHLQNLSEPSRTFDVWKPPKLAQASKYLWPAVIPVKTSKSPAQTSTIPSNVLNCSSARSCRRFSHIASSFVWTWPKPSTPRQYAFCLNTTGVAQPNSDGSIGRL